MIEVLKDFHFQSSALTGWQGERLFRLDLLACQNDVLSEKGVDLLIGVEHLGSVSFTALAEDDDVVGDLVDQAQKLLLLLFTILVFDVKLGARLVTNVQRHFCREHGDS